MSQKLNQAHIDIDITYELTRPHQAEIGNMLPDLAGREQPLS